MNECKLLNWGVKWFQGTCVAALLCHLTLAAIFREAFCGVTWLPDFWARVRSLPAFQKSRQCKCDTAQMGPSLSVGSCSWLDINRDVCTAPLKIPYCLWQPLLSEQLFRKSLKPDKSAETGLRKCPFMGLGGYLLFWNFFFSLWQRTV